jgi:hypothetical protein
MINRMIKAASHRTSDGKTSGPVAKPPLLPTPIDLAPFRPAGQEAAALVDQVLTWMSGYLPQRDGLQPNA